MKVMKVFNNNVVLVHDAQGQEVVVMGRGIGFQKKTSDQLDETKIDKTFVLDAQNAGFSEIYRDLPPEEVDLVLEIVNLAEKELEQSFQSSLYITLADHLHFAIERQKAGVTLTNPLAWEIRKFYKNEYKIGLRALEIVKQKLAIELAQEEASSIALHIVNAQKQGQLIEQTMRIITVVQDILNIVRLHFGIAFDEDSISYNRFFTHLQYFAQRVNDGTQQGSNDSFLYEQVYQNYPEAFACAEKIKQYIESTYDFPVGRDEEVYLAIHIQRLIS